jgi:hypothetical protein
MTQAVDAIRTHPLAGTTRRTGANAHAAGAGFDAMLSLLGEPAGGIGPGPETIESAIEAQAADPDATDLDDMAAEEMRSPTQTPEHLKPTRTRPQAERAPTGRSRSDATAPQARPAPPPQPHAFAPAAPTQRTRPAPAVARPAAGAKPASAGSRAKAAAPFPAVEQAAARTAAPAAARGVATGGVRSVGAVTSAPGAGKGLLAKLADRQKPPILRATKEELPAQVSRALARVVSEGGGRITLRLHPQALGEVRVDVQMRRGVTSARLSTETDEARDLLKHGLDTLRTALERRGVSVERLEVIGPGDEQSPRTDADAGGHGDHPAGTGESSGRGRSAARTDAPAEPGAGDGQAAERAARSIMGPPVRTDADGVVRIDAVA